jgi:oligopeptide/dipeptide ABC transporter ATP-binding protein
MAELILEARDVVKNYPGARRGTLVQALRGVSVELEAGKTLGIVGESGSGKSTLARQLVGLETPTSGTITLAGREMSAKRRPKPRELARLIQMVFQDPFSSLNPRLTVREAIGEALKVHRLASGDGVGRRVTELLSMVALPERFAPRYPHELSGGQAQRVAVARALAVEPRILVLDEPTSALDVSVRAEVMNLLVRLQDELALAYVFVSHDISMVRHMSDAISVMYLGRVVEEGPYQEVLDNPLHPYTRALTAAVPVPDPDARSAAEFRRAARAEVVLEQPPEVGCPYQPRCPLAIAVCSTVLPPLVALRPNHEAACHVAAAEAGVATVSASDSRR